uniref:hypothetical protein n=1 Tax=Legionella pneumophila TaxID=446 RepID=UPI00399CA331
LIHDSMAFLSGKNMDYQSISELLQRIQATGLLRRYAPRNDGPKNRTVQRIFLSKSRKSHFVCTELKWKNAFVSLNCYLMDIEDRI